MHGLDVFSENGSYGYIYSHSTYRFSAAPSAYPSGGIAFGGWWDDHCLCNVVAKGHDPSPMFRGSGSVEES